MVTMEKKISLDDRDKEIISLIERNPEISQKEIADNIGISQPSVGARLRKLKQKGVILPIVGMNVKKLGLNLARVDITTNNLEDILSIFDGCPYFLNGLVMSGKNNISLYFIAEDVKTLRAIVDHHLRSNPHIKDVEFNLAITPIKDMIFPIRINFKKRETAPCGVNCKDCFYYKSSDCLGCPASIHYKGNFW